MSPSFSDVIFTVGAWNEPTKSVRLIVPVGLPISTLSLTSTAAPKPVSNMSDTGRLFTAASTMIASSAMWNGTEVVGATAWLVRAAAHRAKMIAIPLTVTDNNDKALPEQGGIRYHGFRPGDWSGKPHSFGGACLRPNRM